MEDIIIEPVRKSLIPKFDEMKAASLSAGALGGGISGSGPSVFMLSETLEVASNVETALRRVFKATSIDFHIYCSEISAGGVKVL
jgi:homoserine kinase